MKIKEIYWVPTGTHGYLGYIGKYRVCSVLWLGESFSLFQDITSRLPREIDRSFTQAQTAKEYFEKVVMRDVFDLFFEEE